MNVGRFFVGFAAAAGIAAAAMYTGSLTMSGAAAAAAVGTCVHGGLGPRGTLLMLAFFVPSSALSKALAVRDDGTSVIAKSGPRDASQVLANGGAAALAALGGDRPQARLAFAASLAAAASDTWSTDIGMRFGGTPRDLLTGTAADNGISGNVSEAGLVGGIAGAALMALLGATLGFGRFRTICVAGVAGGLVDSLLGATVQSRSRCTVCDSTCEIATHCDRPTEHIHGIAVIDNDMVNAIAVLSAIVAAAILELH